jgi:FtsP/CotA-like multicopper oxidase with cupredoxin domain
MAASQREIELHLTGHMESSPGRSTASRSPRRALRLNYGERMRIVLVNDTMMQHPIHLHGMWSDLENAEAFQVRKHTSTCRRARAAATACAPMPSAAGPTTATCCTTWKRA